MQPNYKKFHTDHRHYSVIKQSIFPLTTDALTLQILIFDKLVDMFKVSFD